jgi:hypothetical protein
MTWEVTYVMAVLLRAGVQGDKETGVVGGHPVVCPQWLGWGFKDPPDYATMMISVAIAPPQKGLKI